MTIPEKKNADYKKHSVYYELKTLDAKILLVKIENLREGEQFVITVETDYGLYKGCVILFGKNFII